MTVSERQAKGMAYIVDADMKLRMKECRALLQKLNTMDRNDEDGISAVIRQLFGKSSTFVVRPPFYCDYGAHIEAGKNFFANYNCTMLDVGFDYRRGTFAYGSLPPATPIIGDNCQIAPNVCIYAGGHPIHPETRNTARVIRTITDDDKRLLLGREEIDGEAWGDIFQRIMARKGSNE